MKKALYTTVLSALLPLALYAQGSVSEKEIQQKDITIIHGQSTADGKSQIGERILEECIVSLQKLTIWNRKSIPSPLISRRSMVIRPQ